MYQLIISRGGVLEDVLGLGLEAKVLGLKAYKSLKTSCPRLEDRIIFWLVEKENNLTKYNSNFLPNNSFSFLI